MMVQAFDAAGPSGIFLRAPHGFEMFSVNEIAPVRAGVSFVLELRPIKMTSTADFADRTISDEPAEACAAMVGYESYIFPVQNESGTDPDHESFSTAPPSVPDRVMSLHGLHTSPRRSSNG